MSGQKLHLTTEQYRNPIKARIVELGKRGIKSDPDILKAFRFVFENKRKHAKDDNCTLLSIEHWNITTLTRKSNFIRYLDEAPHKSTTEILTRAQAAERKSKQEAVR